MWEYQSLISYKKKGQRFVHINATDAIIHICKIVDGHHGSFDIKWD